MEEKNNIEKLKEKYPSFFNAFPEKLIGFALSEKTAQKIANICIENKINNHETVEKIAFRITYAIFGKLPIESLPLTLERGAGLEKETAKKISLSAERIIFSQLPDLLEEKEDEEEKEEEKQKVPQKPSSKDVYREPIE